MDTRFHKITLFFIAIVFLAGGIFARIPEGVMAACGDGSNDGCSLILNTYTSTKADGTYGANDTMDIIATFSNSFSGELVSDANIVSGYMDVLLNTGRTIRLEALGGNLIGTYAVSTGETSSGQNLTISNIVAINNVQSSISTTFGNIYAMPNNNLNVTKSINIIEDTIAPSIDSAVVNANTLTLYFNEDTSSPISTSNSFIVMKNNMNSISVSSVSIDGHNITLTLNEIVSSQDSVTVSWGQGSICDMASNCVTEQSTNVTNNTPAPPSAPTIVSFNDDTGESSTDRITNDTSLTFSGTTVSGSTVNVYRDGVLDGAATVDGTSWTFNNVGGLYDGNTYIFTAKATQNSQTSATSSNFSVTIDRSAPQFSSASINGSTLNITMNETLATNTTFNWSDVSITSVGTGTCYPSTYDNVSGAVATFTMNCTVVSGETVTVSYNGSDSPFIDVAGNVAGSFSNQSVTNNTQTQTNAPVISSMSEDTGQSVSDYNTQDTTPTFTGTAVATSTVTVYKDAVSVGTTTADIDGNWSYTFRTLSQGTYSITAKAQSEGEALSQSSNSVSLIVDTTAPTVSGLPDLTASSDTGLSSTDNITRDTTPTFTGSCSAGSEVDVYLNGGAYFTFGNCSSSNFSLTTSEMIGGTYSVIFKEVDIAGNVSTASATTTITVDTASPSISSVASSTGATTASISWTTNEGATSTLRYGTTVSYGSTSTSNSTTTSHAYSLSGLSEGTLYHFQVVSTDTAGNTTTSSDYTFTTTDGTAPTVSMSYPTNGSTVSGTITASSSASDSVGVSGVKFYIDSTLIGSEDTSSPYSVSFDTTSVNSGSYTFRAVARDAAGNVATSTGVSVTIDNDGPVISSESSTTTATTATITWNTDESADSLVEYGPTSSYTASSTYSSSLVTSHSRVISGLATSTTYHYRIVTVDEIGNRTNGSDGTFTTADESTTPEPEPEPDDEPRTTGSRANRFVSVGGSNSILNTLSRALGGGERGEDVLDLQKFLNGLGFFVRLGQDGVPLQETNFFGRATRAALMRFQEAYRDFILDPVGVSRPSGNLDPVTMEVVSAIASNNTQVVPLRRQNINLYKFTKVLKTGDVDPDVKELQKFLNEEGFYVAKSGPGSLGNETERFGAGTREALKAFQEVHRVGILGEGNSQKFEGIFGQKTIEYIDKLRGSR